MDGVNAAGKRSLNYTHKSKKGNKDGGVGEMALSLFVIHLPFPEQVVGGGGVVLRTELFAIVMKLLLRNLFSSIFSGRQ